MRLDYDTVEQAVTNMVTERVRRPPSVRAQLIERTMETVAALRDGAIQLEDCVPEDVTLDSVQAAMRAEHLDMAFVLPAALLEAKVSGVSEFLYARVVAQRQQKHKRAEDLTAKFLRSFEDEIWHDEALRPENPHIFKNNAVLFFIMGDGILLESVKRTADVDVEALEEPSNHDEAVVRALLSLGDDVVMRMVLSARADHAAVLAAKRADREALAERKRREKEVQARQILQRDMRLKANQLLRNLRGLKRTETQLRERMAYEQRQAELAAVTGGGSSRTDARKHKSTATALKSNLISKQGMVLKFSAPVLAPPPNIGTTNSPVAIFYGVRHEAHYHTHTLRVDNHRIATICNWDRNARLSTLMVHGCVTDTGQVMRILRLGEEDVLPAEDGEVVSSDCVNTVTDRLVALQSSNDVNLVAMRISAGPNACDRTSWMTIDFGGHVEYNVPEREAKDLPKVVSLLRVGGTLDLNLVPKVQPRGSLPSLAALEDSDAGPSVPAADVPSSSSSAVVAIGDDPFPESVVGDAGTGADGDAEEDAGDTRKKRRKRTTRALTEEELLGAVEPSIEADWRNPTISIPPNEVWIEDIETFQPGLLQAISPAYSFLGDKADSVKYTPEETLHGASGVGNPSYDKKRSVDPSYTVRLYRDVSGNRPSSYYPQSDYRQRIGGKSKRSQERQGNFKHLLVANVVTNWLVQQPVEVMHCKYAGRRMLELLMPAAVRPDEVGSFVVFSAEHPDIMWIGKDEDHLAPRAIALGHGMEPVSVRGTYVSTGDSNKRMQSWETGHVGQYLNIRPSDGSRRIEQIPNPYAGIVRTDGVQWATQAVHAEVLGAPPPASRVSVLGLPIVTPAPSTEDGDLPMPSALRPVVPPTPSSSRPIKDLPIPTALLPVTSSPSSSDVLPTAASSQSTLSEDPGFDLPFDDDEDLGQSGGSDVDDDVSKSGDGGDDVDDDYDVMDWESDDEDRDTPSSPPPSLVPSNDSGGRSPDGRDTDARTLVDEDLAATFAPQEVRDAALRTLEAQDLSVSHEEDDGDASSSPWPSEDKAAALDDLVDLPRDSLIEVYKTMMGTSAPSIAKMRADRTYDRKFLVDKLVEYDMSREEIRRQALSVVPPPRKRPRARRW